ncbi:hypothetical protein EEDFHM_03845 [Methylorubrum populi]
MHLDLDVVTSVARLLYGDDWQRPLARGLGPHHPDGGRDSIDARLVRRWAAGERPVPAWVASALVALLEAEASASAAHATACQERAERLRLALTPVFQDDDEDDLRP